MAKSKLVVGIDLGGTNMGIGVVDREGKVLGRSRQKTLADKGTQTVLTRIVEGVQAACAEAGVIPSDLLGLGIGAPGAIDPASGTVIEAVNLRWNNVLWQRS